MPYSTPPGEEDLEYVSEELPDPKQHGRTRKRSEEGEWRQQTQSDTDIESITEREAHRRAEADAGLCALPVGADYRPLGAVLR